MTPPTTRASHPNSCTPTRFPPAVVRQPDPWRGTTADRNVYTDALCYKPKPQPARRHDQSSNCLGNLRLISRSWPRAQSLIFALFCGFLLFCQSVQASLHGPSILERELVYDRRPAPKPRMGIYVRQDDPSSSPAATTGSLPGIAAPSSTSSISQSTIETATPISTSLPRPFDASLGNNFTEPSCPRFFNDFLTNTTFQECLPFSLLLQVSKLSNFTAPINVDRD